MAAQLPGSMKPTVTSRPGPIYFRMSESTARVCSFQLKRPARFIMLRAPLTSDLEDFHPLYPDLAQPAFVSLDGHGDIFRFQPEKGCGIGIGSNDVG